MRTLAITKRVLRQFARDKRTLALILVAPNLILGLLSLIFNGDSYRPTIATVEVPVIMVSALKDAKADVLEMSVNGAETALAQADVDAIIRLEGLTPKVQFEGSDPSKTQAVRLTLRDAMAAMNPRAQNDVEMSFLHGSKEMSAFDNFGPVLMGFFIFFFTFIVSGVAFVKERNSGTLERMFSTPLQRWELVAGYALGFSIVIAAQSILLSIVAVYAMGMMLKGSFVLLLLVNLALALTALAMGMFISAFAKSEFQVIQFIPIVIVPQVFFSGLFPLESMAPWLRGVGNVLPMTYGAEALRQVMIRGAGLDLVARPLLILVGLSLLLFLANVKALRAYRSV